MKRISEKILSKTLKNTTATLCQFLMQLFRPQFVSLKLVRQTNTYTPREGDIIFFDWDSDGLVNHVGIVKKVKDGKIHTIEGNSGDACKKLEYNSGDSRILGYGVPAY